MSQRRSTGSPASALNQLTAWGDHLPDRTELPLERRDRQVGVEPGIGLPQKVRLEAVELPRIVKLRRPGDDAGEPGGAVRVGADDEADEHGGVLRRV